MEDGYWTQTSTACGSHARPSDHWLSCAIVKTNTLPSNPPSKRSCPSPAPVPPSEQLPESGPQPLTVAHPHATRRPSTAHPGLRACLPPLSECPDTPSLQPFSPRQGRPHPKTPDHRPTTINKSHDYRSSAKPSPWSQAHSEDPAPSPWTP